jgi:copper chaperone
VRAEPATLTFTVRGMHCASCAALVDDALEDLTGVQHSETDSRRGRTVVQADLALVSVDSIVTAIVNTGYKAEPAPG